MDQVILSKQAMVRHIKSVRPLSTAAIRANGIAVPHHRRDYDYEAVDLQSVPEAGQKRYRLSCEAGDSAFTALHFILVNNSKTLDLFELCLERTYPGRVIIPAVTIDAKIFVFYWPRHEGDAGVFVFILAINLLDGDDLEARAYDLVAALFGSSKHAKLLHGLYEAGAGLLDLCNWDYQCVCDYQILCEYRDEKTYNASFQDCVLAVGQIRFSRVITAYGPARDYLSQRHRGAMARILLLRQVSPGSPSLAVQIQDGPVSLRRGWV